VIEDIIACGRLAATAINIQPWEFVAVTEKKMLRSLAAKGHPGLFLVSQSREQAWTDPPVGWRNRSEWNPSKCAKAGDWRYKTWRPRHRPGPFRPSTNSLGRDLGLGISDPKAENEHYHSMAELVIGLSIAVTSFFPLHSYRPSGGKF
jgi:nitroreductase